MGVDRMCDEGLDGEGCSPAIVPPTICELVDRKQFMALNEKASAGVPDDASSEVIGTCNRDEIVELMMLLAQIMQEPAAVQELLSGHVVQLETQIRRLAALGDYVREP